ncbi:hypothetical protein AMECASPLE_028898 [Ameca splendens]|uniref:Uncharacterized protein n=1 Tax=Ameca splendens TaxID=208324 RepID=A0ABV0ZQG3_9TELE
MQLTIGNVKLCLSPFTTSASYFKVNNIYDTGEDCINCKETVGDLTLQKLSATADMPRGSHRSNEGHKAPATILLLLGLKQQAVLSALTVIPR